MNVLTKPDAFQKLTLMGDVTLYEPAGDAPEKERDRPYQSRSLAECITNVSTPKGSKPILKTMLTTACEKNCYYCPFRAGRGKTRRVTFKPDELARAFDELQRAKLVEGIFLSSGIVGGGVRTQDKIIDTIEIIRKKHAYEGYVHLKIMPGAEYDQVVRAMQLADRVSINLEGATAERLHALAPKKDFEQELLQRLKWAHDIRERMRHEAPGSIRAGSVTQFVVGAVGDTDLELLSLTDHLHQQAGLRRAYFSRFSPVRDTPFEHLPEVPAIRERRLYEASFLLRDYQWDVEELPFEGEGNLRLDVDPKRAWADVHLREAPVDVMAADLRDLLRIPGIGPKGARAILRARRTGRLRELADLRKIGLRGVERAAPYVLLDGRRPPQQLPLFEDAGKSD
jgi:predicted DNA-binding helix-hairpin-helix protein